jgi:hypothetical protein
MAREFMQNPVISGPEEITNFNNALLEQKTLFSKQVKNFVTGLSYGAVCCDEDDNLKNFQRKLDILTNYDTRDIYNCTETTYILSEENKEYKNAVVGAPGNAILTSSALPTSSSNLTSIDLATTPYKETFTNYKDSWLKTNFNFGDLIRITEQNSLPNSLRTVVCIIELITSSDYAEHVLYNLIPLWKDIIYGGDFQITSDFLLISKPGKTSTFTRNTSGAPNTAQFSSLTNLTTTAFNNPTYFQFLTTDWTNEFVNNDYLALFTEATTAYATYLITNIVIVGEYTNFYVSNAQSNGSFYTSTSRIWYLSRINHQLSVTTIPEECTSDTTNYNNISYTEIKKLLNS